MEVTGMQNPLFNLYLNRGDYLDNMLIEMSNELINLQSNMSKVITGINKLKNLLSNIQEYRTNNKIMNNPMMNPMENQMMMNPMINNMNIDINTEKQFSNISETFTVFFEDNYRGEKRSFSILTKNDEKISEIIKKYRQKSSNYSKNIDFIFNAKHLNPSLTVSEAGLINGHAIQVICNYE